MDADELEIELRALAGRVRALEGAFDALAVRTGLTPIEALALRAHAMEKEARKIQDDVRAEFRDHPGGKA
jgi:hypothetical protein